MIVVSDLIKTDKWEVQITCKEDGRERLLGRIELDLTDNQARAFHYEFKSKLQHFFYRYL